MKECCDDLWEGRRKTPLMESTSRQDPGFASQEDLASCETASSNDFRLLTCFSRSATHRPIVSHRPWYHRTIVFQLYLTMGWFSSEPSPAPDKQPPSVQSTETTEYRPLKRNERKACWEARDIYFGCLDKNNILDAVKDGEEAKNKCPKEDDLFEKDCATSWVCCRRWALCVRKRA